MADFQPLSPLARLRRVAELNPDALNFKAFKPLSKQKEASRVVALAFCPLSPYRLAVVSGTKVSLWKRGARLPAGASAASTAAAVNLEADGTLSKFKDLVQCAAWRNDGKLMLVGEAGGSCSLIDPESRKSLRRFMGHGDAVTCASFSAADRSHAATGGRDGRLRIWDVTTGDLLQTVDAGSDCLKAIAPGPGGPDGWITTGYDGHVRLWDLRASGATASSSSTSAACVADCDHGHPVEAGTAFPGGAMYVSAGGPAVKVWDLASGGRLVESLPEAHSKAVMAVCLDSQASVLVTASFDGLAKVYQAADLRHVWTYKLPGPATCAAWRPDDRAFAVGFEDGLWQLRQRRIEADVQAAAAETEPAKKPRAKRLGQLRGLSSKPAEDDEVVEFDRPKKKRDTTLDFYFRRFEYRKVVEHLVQPGTAPAIGLASIDELLRRGALRDALRDLGEDMCLLVLQWLVRVFTTVDALQHKLFTEALYTLLDCNKCLQPPSTPGLLEVLGKLENKARQEIHIIEALRETSGVLRALTSLQ